LREWHQTVAVYSEADVNSLHVRFADERSASARAPGESYLDPGASSRPPNHQRRGHTPGYGFLRNPDLRNLPVVQYRLYRPNYDVIRSLATKPWPEDHEGRGVNVIPGSDARGRLKTAEAMAEMIGYPIMIKAVAGGGGRGMRLVTGPPISQVLRYGRPRQAPLGNPDVYMERYISSPVISKSRYWPIITQRRSSWRARLHLQRRPRS